MAKLVEYNVEGVEESHGGTGVKVKPGVKIARIDLMEVRTEKSDGSPANDIRLGLNFGSEFDWGFTYVGLGEASDWKLAELIRALGLKDKGKFDPDKMKGKFIRVKVNSGTYQGEYSPEMGRLMPPQPGDDKAWAAGNTGVSEISNSGASGDGEPQDEEAAQGGGPNDDAPRWREGQPDPENPDDIVGSYDGWSDEDLEAEVTDRDLTLPGGRASKKNKMIAALRADDEAAAANGEPEPDDGAVAADGDDYDEWAIDRLKQEWEDRNFGDLPEIRGRGAAERLKAAIIEEIRKDDVENPFAG